MFALPVASVLEREAIFDHDQLHKISTGVSMYHQMLWWHLVTQHMHSPESRPHVMFRTLPLNCSNCWISL